MLGVVGTCCVRWHGPLYLQAIFLYAGITNNLIVVRIAGMYKLTSILQQNITTKQKHI